MKILVAHNFYQQPGGEDMVFRDEVELLKKHGHDVLTYTKHNDAIDGMGSLDRFRATIFHQKTYDELTALIDRERPEVAHFHNTFPLISAAGYRAAKDRGIPVVQTLHNYRFLCANGLFFRDNRICEDCLGRRFPWPAVRHRCYRGSLGASAAVSIMLSQNRRRGVFTDWVDAYVVLTEFGRGKFIQGGLPTDKLHLKPNFVDPDPGVGGGEGNYALFVGRLDAYKGVRTVLSAWRALDGDVLPLKIVGEGELAEEVMDAARESTVIEYVGPKSHSDVLAMMQSASVLVFASELFEGFPRVIVEALAVGTPVVTTTCGTAASVIVDGITGYHFEAGSVEGLVAAMGRARDSEHLRANCRAEFERLYTGDRSHELLLEIYRAAQSVMAAERTKRDPR